MMRKKQTRSAAEIMASHRGQVYTSLLLKGLVWLAALAAAGDRSALRECVEVDPALAGRDRLYVQDVVEKMIQLHSDVLSRFDEEEE